MCQRCYEEAGCPWSPSDEVDAAVESLRALYLTHAAGGHLHVVTDDENVDDGNLSWCRREMEKKAGDVDAEEWDALRRFETLSGAERWTALAIFWGYEVNPRVAVRAARAAAT